jgi:hypothetical protein
MGGIRVEMTTHMVFFIDIFYYCYFVSFRSFQLSILIYRYTPPVLIFSGGVFPTG